MKTPNHLFNLAMAVSELGLQQGERRTHHDLACFIEATVEEMTGQPFKMSWQRFHQIEQKALRKIRIHITRELNNDAKEVLFDGLRLLSQTKVNLWDQQTKRLQ